MRISVNHSLLGFYIGIWTELVFRKNSNLKNGFWKERAVKFQALFFEKRLLERPLLWVQLTCQIFLLRILNSEWTYAAYLVTKMLRRTRKWLRWIEVIALHTRELLAFWWSCLLCDKRFSLQNLRNLSWRHCFFFAIWLATGWVVLGNNTFVSSSFIESLYIWLGVCSFYISIKCRCQHCNLNRDH